MQAIQQKNAPNMSLLASHYELAPDPARCRLEGPCLHRLQSIVEEDQITGLRPAEGGHRGCKSFRFLLLILAIRYPAIRPGWQGTRMQLDATENDATSSDASARGAAWAVSRRTRRVDTEHNLRSTSSKQTSGGTIDEASCVQEWKCVVRSGEGVSYPCISLSRILNSIRNDTEAT